MTKFIHVTTLLEGMPEGEEVEMNTTINVASVQAVVDFSSFPDEHRGHLSAPATQTLIMLDHTEKPLFSKMSYNEVSNALRQA